MMNFLIFDRSIGDRGSKISRKKKIKEILYIGRKAYWWNCIKNNKHSFFSKCENINKALKDARSRTDENFHLDTLLDFLENFYKEDSKLNLTKLETFL